MKKILMVVAVVAAFGISAMAQDKGEARIGIAIDGGASKVGDSDNTFGFTVGVKGDYGLSDKVFLNATLGYAARGGKNIKLGYITLPVNIGWSFVKSENFSAFAEVGPSFGFKVSADETNIQYLGGSYKTKAKGFEMGLGIGVGCEFAKHFQAKVFYNFGLTNAYEGEGSTVVSGGINEWSGTAKNKYFGIGLAYMF